MEREDLLDEYESLLKENYELVRQNKEYRRRIAELEARIIDQSETVRDNELLKAENGDLYDEIKARQCQIDSLPSKFEVESLRAEVVRLKDELKLKPDCKILDDLKRMINWLNDEYELALDPLDPRCLIDYIEFMLKSEKK